MNAFNILWASLGVCVSAQLHEPNDKSDGFLIVSAIYGKT